MTVHALKTIGGEFACPDREARFRNERLPETIRHGRLLEEHRGWAWTVIDNVTPESDLAAPRPPA